MEQEKNRPREQQKDQKKNGRKVLIAVVVVIAAAAGVFGYNYVQKGKIQELLAAEGIFQGVTIGGVDVAGLSEAEAVALLQDKYKTEIGGQMLTLYYDGKADIDEDGEVEELKWEIPFSEIGAGYHVEDAVKGA